MRFCSILSLLAFPLLLVSVVSLPWWATPVNDTLGETTVPLWLKNLNSDEVTTRGTTIRTATSPKPRFTLAVLFLESLLTILEKTYKNVLQCAIDQKSSSGGDSLITDSYELSFKLAYKSKSDLSPRGVLDSICDEFEDEPVSAMLLVVTDGSSKMPIYKYLVNSMSALGIPIITWNDHEMTESVYNEVIQIAPTIDQQARAHISLLNYYKWNKFSILMTPCPGHLEYLSAIQRLVRLPENSGKGSQSLAILSSHIIKSIKKEEAITEELESLRQSDTRVILLHMSGSDVVSVMKHAATLKLVGHEFMWIGTSFIYQAGGQQPAQLPLGMISIKKPEGRTYKQARGALTLSYHNVLYAAADFWMESLARLQKADPNVGPPPPLSCDKRNFVSWTNGTLLYRQMISHTYTKPSVICGDDDVKTSNMAFDHGGSNKHAELTFMNLAWKKADSSRSGASGRIHEWREIGKWNSPNVTELDDIAWPGDSPKPPEGKPARSFLRIVTHKEAPYVKYADPNPLTGECDIIGSVRVQITPQFTAKNCPECLKNSSLFQCATGLCIDLLDMLQRDMNFDYELVNSKDDQWGNYEDKQKTVWNGIVKDLMEGYADISMTTLKIGPERSKAIDFSVPFIETGITIIVYIKKGVISAKAFLEPYKYSVWAIVCCGLSCGMGLTLFIFEWGSPKGMISINRKKRRVEPYDVLTWLAVLGGMVHAMGFFILIFDYISPSLRHRYTQGTGERFSLARSLWLIWTILFGAAVDTDNTKGLASRFLAAIWSLFSLVFLASYTANLAAFMITKEEYYALSGMNDPKLKNPLSEKPPFRFATVPDGSTALNLAQHHPTMFKYMEKYNKVNVKVGIEAVKNNELQAFIYDATVLEYEASRDEGCRLTTVGSWYAMTGYGIGFPKGSKWKKTFDIYLAKYIHEGDMDRLRKFWLVGACKKLSSGKGRVSSHSLDIINFTSAYILLVVGIVLSVLLLLAEHIYFTFCRRRLRKIDRCGCCSLISLSMGESLSFEESVLEVLESARMQCSNELCRATQQKMSHDLDVAICRLNMLQASLRAQRRSSGSNFPEYRNHPAIESEPTNEEPENPGASNQKESSSEDNATYPSSNNNKDNSSSVKKRLWNKAIHFEKINSCEEQSNPLIRSNERLDRVETSL